jgi:ComEC/Rec2-related protein
LKRPLTGLAATYAAGVWIGSLLGGPAMMWCVIAAILLAVFLFLQRTRFGLMTLLAAVLVVGASRYRQAVTISSPIDITRLLEERDQSVQMQGVIVTDTGSAVPLNEDELERQRFELRVTAVEHYGQWEPTVGRILIFVSETREAEPLQYGDRITFSAVLRVPPPMRNPGAFDWQTWLDRRGIHFTATIRKTDLVHVEAHNQGNPVIAVSLRLSEYLESALKVGLENEPKLAGALAAMVLGKRSEIPTETYADFQRTGVFHVFAINGLHVGLVTLMVLVVLRLVRIPRRWCAVAAVPLLILYVFATGEHPGAVRALVMACVWLMGWMLVRPADSLNTLAAAALVILVYAPTQLLDGGFLLSFSVVLAIVILTPRIEALLLMRIAPDPFLPREFVPKWRTKLVNGLYWIIQLLSCSIAAWLGLMPLMAIYFHLFTPISIVANLLVIPLLGSILAVGLLAALVHVASTWLTLTLNNANAFLLSIMIRGVEWLGHIPFGHCFVSAPPLWLVWAYYAIGILLLSKWIPATRRGLAAVLAVPTMGVALFLSGGSTNKVELTVLSLNDGMSVFIDALASTMTCWSMAVVTGAARML